MDIFVNKKLKQVNWIMKKRARRTRAKRISFATQVEHRPYENLNNHNQPKFVIVNGIVTNPKDYYRELLNRD